MPLDNASASTRLAFDSPNPELTPAHKRFAVGITSNAAYQPPNSVFEFSQFALSIVEFDDQGRCYCRQQMHALKRKLDKLVDKDPIIVVFVHGWKHNGCSDDENLMEFRKVLQNVATQAGPSAPVLGVFIAWRGLSLYGFNVLENVTFWDRKQAGLRVAMGAPRELLSHLRTFRRNRLRAGGTPLLAIIGHSFGGLIVFSAIAQSLIEAASTSDGELIPPFADLVLLVNPAFEAVRYLPIYDLVAERNFAEGQQPIFVCVTATNDWATRFAFPTGMAIALLQEKTKDREERQALIRTMGHIPWMRTHTLQRSGDSQAVAQAMPNAGRNPFWVISAPADVVDGHNGIWLPTFIGFVQDLMLKHAQQATDRRRRKPPA